MKIEKSLVTYIDSMGSDLSVCNAARVSFHKESEWLNSKEEWINDFDLQDNEFFYKNPKFEGQLSPGDQKLIKYLAKHNHFTPFCHAFFTFRIRADFATIAQLFKHQVGLTANSVSRRYVDDEPTFFLPETWRIRPDNVKQGSSETETVSITLEQYAAAGGVPFQDPTVDNLMIQHYARSLALYNHLLEMGVAPEQARWSLPIGANSEFIWSGSLMAFARVYNLRIDPHAQKEVRDVAIQIADLIPSSFKHSWAALTTKE